MLLELSIRQPLFILASASPRRRALLDSLGLCFEVAENQWIEEPRRREKPRRQAQRLSREKLAHFRRSNPKNRLPVLTADTLIDIEGRVLNKPANFGDAENYYRLLAGRTHLVVTAVCFGLSTGRVIHRTVTTKVKFLPWNEKLYREYLNTGEWQGVAGGYRLQESGFRLVDRINGSWSNVVGLPLAEVYGILRSHLTIQNLQS
jgi:septum formation protein